MKILAAIATLIFITQSVFANTDWNKYELAIQYNNTSFLHAKNISQPQLSSKDKLFNITRRLKSICEEQISQIDIKELVNIQKELSTFIQSGTIDPTEEQKTIAKLLIFEADLCPTEQYTNK